MPHHILLSAKCGSRNTDNEIRDNRPRKPCTRLAGVSGRWQLCRGLRHGSPVARCLWHGSSLQSSVTQRPHCSRQRRDQHCRHRHHLSYLCHCPCSWAKAMCSVDQQGPMPVDHVQLFIRAAQSGWAWPAKEGFSGKKWTCSVLAIQDMSQLQVSLTSTDHRAHEVQSLVYSLQAMCMSAKQSGTWPNLSSTPTFLSDLSTQGLGYSSWV